MLNKLYVSNLSQAATLSSLRELFGGCGDVVEVEFAAERTARVPSAAYVTMATSAGAEGALRTLHGRIHGDRTMMISRLAGDGIQSDARSPRGSRGSDKADARASVSITQQYRDRFGLTYELACSEKLLTLRFILPPDDAQEWRVEARVMPGGAAPVTSSGMTREQAFQALVAAWSQPNEGLLDWDGVASALRAVRAL